MTAAPALDPAADLPLPHRFGNRYVLFDRIGAGGMAEIFLAREQTQIGAGRLAVVKLVLPHLSHDPKFAGMLVAEAKLAAKLSHTNVVQTYDLGREEGRLYIAMEYVEGFDLNELLKRCAKMQVPLPAEFAFFVVAEALRALDHAHRRKGPDGVSLGIVHRDVSPSNVLLSFEGEVKLCDFGIARAASTTADLSSETIEGKAQYMAPEQASGLEIDGRADVFAAALILYRLLAGKRPYRKPAPGEHPLAQARAADIPPLPDRGLPDHARLAGILARGLAKSPDDRYATALDMARDLDAYAMSHRLIASPLKLGDWIVEHFGAEILEVRRAREHAAAIMVPPSTPPPAIVRQPDASVNANVGDAPTPSITEASKVRVREHPAVVPPGTPEGLSRAWRIAAGVSTFAVAAATYWLLHGR